MKVRLYDVKRVYTQTACPNGSYDGIWSKHYVKWTVFTAGTCMQFESISARAAPDNNQPFVNCLVAVDGSGFSVEAIET